MDAVSRVPAPVNEPVRQYAPGSHERAALESKIKELAGQQAELTMTINGQQQLAHGDRIDVVQPRNPRGQAGGSRVARTELRRPGRDLPQGSRTALHNLAPDAERRDRARPVQV